jgi:single-stranded DNA-specific DHH superfamily exonuclease
MSHFDVFNGDADGICALQQLRLAEPRDSQLVTGVKRDISLLRQVQAGAADTVTVLDISLDKNRDDLVRLLDAGASVQYFDHHFAGDIPEHARLDVHINTAATVCTSLLVNDHLGGAYLTWAVTAAFGDNLSDSAISAARPLQLKQPQLEQLQILGILINYNGYGSTLADLFFPPAELYRRISPYTDPFDFIHNDDAFVILQDGYEADMSNASQLRTEMENDNGAVLLLPDAAWARRVSGVYANDLAQQFPRRAHALLTRKPGGGFVVSVRAPLATREGADDLCRQFPTGGGRKAAAGINHLADNQLDEFLQRFHSVFDG